MNELQREVSCIVGRKYYCEHPRPSERSHFENKFAVRECLIGLVDNNIFVNFRDQSLNR